MKKKILCAVLCLCLCSCKPAYIVKPTGTHETAPVSIQVPATTSEIVTEGVTKDSEDALDRLHTFYTKLDNDFSVNATWVKTVGETVERETYSLQYSGGLSYTLLSNKEGVPFQTVVSNADGSFLLDLNTKTAYQGTKTDFKFADKQQFKKMFLNAEGAYVSTTQETFKGASLTCDTYVVGSTDYKLYYDSNTLIMLGMINELYEEFILFNSFVPTVDTTKFEVPTDYKIEKFIVKD